MMLLTIKLDVALGASRITDTKKRCARFHRQCFFMTFPPERLWLYLKVSQNIHMFDLGDFTIQIADLVLDGIEDKFAKCESDALLEGVKVQKSFC